MLWIFSDRLPHQKVNQGSYLNPFLHMTFLKHDRNSLKIIKIFLQNTFESALDIFRNLETVDSVPQQPVMPVVANSAQPNFVTNFMNFQSGAVSDNASQNAQNNVWRKLLFEKLKQNMSTSNQELFEMLSNKVWNHFPNNVKTFIIKFNFNMLKFFTQGNFLFLTFVP